MYAIQSINMPYFVDLGGVQYYDINFEKASSGCGTVADECIRGGGLAATSVEGQ